MAGKCSPFDVQFTQNCKNHKKSYQTYCRCHEAPCCKQCEREHHKKCKDIVPLSHVVRDINMPSYFTEVQEQLHYLLSNLKSIQEETQQNSKKIKEQRKRVEGEIRLVRQKINDHLDKLQAGVIHELSEIEANTNKTTQELLKSLKEKEHAVIEMQQNMVKITQKGTDLLAFIHMKQTEAVAVQNENYLHLLKEQGELDQVQLSFHINDSIINFQHMLKNLGEISVETIQSTVVIERVKAKQAQRLVSMSSKSIDKISMEINRKIIHGCRDVTGCCILSNGTTLFSAFIQDKVVAVNKEGSKVFGINLIQPRGITSINDNSIAIATIPSISIINTENRSVRRMIKVKGSIDGMTYKDGRLICSVPDKGIRSISLEDESVTSIVDCNLPAFSYVTTCGDNIYYTGGSGSNTVTCCDFKGNIQWQFEDKEVLIGATGTTIDEVGNIFVAGYHTNNVVVISSDGKHNKIILNKDNGLSCPLSLHYDKTTKELLVSNYQQTALLFKVI